MEAWMYDWHMIWMAIWSLMTILMVVAVVWTLTRHLPHLHLHRPHETPEDILKRRYASGEIDKAQYDDMLQDLRRQ